MRIDIRADMRSLRYPMEEVPAVLEVKTDPEVAPLPPHITFEQAMSFADTLLKSDIPRRPHHC